MDIKFIHSEIRHHLHSIVMHGLQCGYCLKRLTDQEHHNAVFTDLPAWWVYPVLYDSFDHDCKAIGFQCNDCYQEKKPLILVPEWDKTHARIRIHSIASLQSMKQLKKKNDVAEYLALANSSKKHWNPGDDCYTE